MSNTILVKTNKNIYKTLSKINKLKIPIYDIYFHNKEYYFKIDYKDYEKLRKTLPSLAFKIVRSYGIRHFYKILKKYQFFFISSIIGIIFLLFISNIIIEVKVVHSSQDIRTLITDALEKEGIKRLSFKKDYQDIERIKKRILTANKDKIEWIEIENKGMKYIVRVEQRIITSHPKENEYCHIIAKKSGVIRDILTKRGESIVSHNTYVNENDILISGDITFNNEIKASVCADGIVKAEVWYKVNVSMPLKYNKYVKKNKTRLNFAYDKGSGKNLILRSRLKNSSKNYQKLFSLFNVWFYLVKEENYIIKTLKYSEEEATEKAILLALEKINIKKNEQDKIITQKVLKKSLNDSTINLEMFFAIEEEIGVQKALNRDGEVS